VRFSPIASGAVLLLLIAGVAACGTTPTKSGSSKAAEATLPAVVTGSAPPTAPTVKVPAIIPTKLVTTDLKPGTGTPAANGDTVVVQYIGVRSKDGVRFDDSYSRGTPFPVTLGTGSVIKGWDQGLVGVTTGMRRQLDIPPDLAYGSASQGDVIGPNEALTFVVDVLAVIKPPDPSTAPASSLAPSGDVPAALVTKDLVVGTGQVIADGLTMSFAEVVYQGDTGALLGSTWTTNTLQAIVYAKDKTIPALYAGLAGMRVGGRRQITVQAGQGLGARGVAQNSIPANRVLIFVIDLVAVY
jgi:peptidylprolyl isomerase